MKLSTKTVASLLVVTAVAATIPGVSQLAIPKKRRESLFDKLLNVHDRKGELRAEILGISAYEFKQLCRDKSFVEIIQSCGFYNSRDFRIALMGKLRNELLTRGWTRSRIDTYVLMRAGRMSVA